MSVADRRRNRDLHHITDLRNVGVRCLRVWIVLGALVGYAVIGRAVWRYFTGG